MHTSKFGLTVLGMVNNLLAQDIQAALPHPRRGRGLRAGGLSVLERFILMEGKAVPPCLAVLLGLQNKKPVSGLFVAKIACGAGRIL